MRRFVLISFLLLAFLAMTQEGSAQMLRVVTLNVWSGLDYKGFIAFGEHESDDQRDRRFRILVDHLKELNPDVVALQEVNPVYDKAEILAGELGYNALYLRGNAGIKFGGMGLPVNLNEGVILLARRDIELQLLDGVDLSPGFGATGNTFAFHFKDRDIGLAVRIRKEGAEVIVVNVHLSSALPDNEELQAMLRTFSGKKDQAQLEEDSRRLSEGQEGRMQEVEELLAFLSETAGDAPTIIMGDLNATPNSPELKTLAGDGGFQDIAQRLPHDRSSTWDPQRNSNIEYSTETWEARSSDSPPYDLLTSWYDTQPRRIDHILLSRHFRVSDVRSVSRQFDDTILDTYVSDHYGLMAELDLSRLPRTTGSLSQAPQAANLDVLPIASYDTDVGFGVGLKTFYLNGFGASESFDLLLFSSTGGERLAKLVFSIPDFEVRQGTVYPLSLDMVVEYDKYLKNSFFGLGNASQFKDRETYTKEPIEFSALFGRGFSRNLVLEAGMKYRIVRNFNYADTSLFAMTPPSLNQGTSSGFTVAVAARYDSRSSFIHPNRGDVVQLEVEYGRRGFLSDYDILKTSLSLQGYRPIFSPKTILALRISGQIAKGDSLPVHTLPWLGGSKTMRGYPLDRYLDKVRILTTIEVRFPIVWRVGGIVGLDAGKVWDRPSAIDLRRWAYNGVFGLRFYFDTFVARADFGLSRETMGFYLDFGHSF
jgi:endonuclease/exonuclease/phosphatase family metal-dependent hydrolase